MSSEGLNFEDYDDSCLADCLKLFDSNCPRFFAENERQDYIEYLGQNTGIYKVGFCQGEVVAAFGVRIDQRSSRGRITWIMVSPFSKGRGIGAQMMTYARKIAGTEGVSELDIAASHLSAPFFEKFGATVLRITPDGWGPNMDRVDMALLLSPGKSVK